MSSVEASGLRQSLYAQVATSGEDEYVRLRLQHELLKRAMGGRLIRAPIASENLHILDSATADGLWMVDVSKDLPTATFRGADLEARHFTHIKDLPSNITFEKHSVFDAWPESYQSTYDLVHQKYCLSIGEPARAAAAVKKLVQCAKPGAYVQLVEPEISDYRFNGDHTGFRMLGDFVDKSFNGASLNPNPGRYAKSWLEQAGLEDIHEEIVTYELGASEKDPDSAAKSEVSIMSMLEMYQTVASNIPNYFYTKDDFAKLKHEVQQELSTVGNRWKVYVVWGRRPQ